MSFPTFVPGLTDREAIADAIFRYMAGIDDNDAALLSSAFTEDAVFDLTSFGDPAALFHGRKPITDHLLRSVGGMDTLHQMTNQRIWISEAEGTAKVLAYALAQHKRVGEGTDYAAEELLLGSRMMVDAVRVKEEEGRWAIQRFVIKGAWGRGSWAVMAGQKQS